MAAYYNEIDLYCAAWLKNLMASGQIPSGEVDTRPIHQVHPTDLLGYKQCHFFAGIGGWAIAARMAGVSDNMEMWTGSPPCQPFSSAGKKKAQKDERHLWPEFYRLIKARKPPVIFGEQVDAAITHGWWDDVADDLEREGYETGSAVLPACSVGAPHQRKRLFFVGNAKHDGRHESSKHRSVGTCENQGRLQQPERPDTSCTMANSNESRLQGHRRLITVDDTERRQKQNGWDTTDSFFSGKWTRCPDGKQRLVKSSIHLLSHGVHNRAPKLRAYGNAIVPQLAAEFIKASMECVNV